MAQRRGEPVSKDYSSRRPVVADEFRTPFTPPGNPSLPAFPPLGRCQVTETSLDATALDWLRGGLRTSQSQGLALSTILQNLQNGYVSGNDRGVAQVQRSRPSNNHLLDDKQMPSLFSFRPLGAKYTPLIS